ncbi:MAG: aldo/keto reductase, partial [Armatimonadetes bacterium]|nr:aldo/keto reductase [Armatimonadota bacterium]
QRGRTEAILGRALRGHREDALIATRGGGTLSPEPNRPRHSRASLRAQVEESLKRLQTDHIDLFLLHYPDPLTPLAESLEVLASLIDQGKIRYYGLSNYTAWQTAEIVWEAEDRGVPFPVLNQVNYNLLRRSQELDLFVVCDQYGLGVAPYSSFQGGLLTGRYQPNSSLRPHHREKMREWLAGMTEDCWQAVDLICSLAEEVGKTPAQYALAWTLAQPGVCSVILGITEAEHIEEAVAAEAWEIPADHFARIDDLTAGKRLLV